MHEVYLEKLSAFSRILRMEGLPVSPRETEDAANILTRLGFADRQTVKTALRTVYAKSREEQGTFDRAFDGFFLSEEAIRAQAQERARQQQEQQAQREQAREELEDIRQRVRLDEQEQLSYQELPEQARQKLKDFLNRYKGNVDRSPQLYSEFIHSVFAKTMMEQQMLLENAGVGAEEVDPELGILCRDIGAFRDSEIPKAIAMIEAVARQLNGELSAKRRGTAASGKLDFRRTIRGSVAMSPAPWCSFRSLPCGLSSLSTRWRRALRFFCFQKPWWRRTPSNCRIWIGSGIRCAPPASMAGGRIWGWP